MRQSKTRSGDDRTMPNAIARRVFVDARRG